MTPLTMDVHGFLHGENPNVPRTNETELAELLTTLSRGATRTLDKRAEIARDRSLSPEGRREADRKLRQQALIYDYCTQTIPFGVDSARWQPCARSAPG